MGNWTADELKQIGTIEEIDIAALDADGRLGKRVTIWVVRVQDGLYIRAYRGLISPWYRATQVRHQGRLYAAEAEWNVTFEAADPQLNDQIDAQYRSKYREHDRKWVDPMVTEAAHSTTIKLVRR